MLRTSRYVYFIGVVVLFTLIFYLVPRLQQPSPSQQQKGSVQQQQQHPPATPQNYGQQYNDGQAPTRYFSWLPHGYAMTEWFIEKAI